MTTNLEISKRLAELGAPQGIKVGTFFYEEGDFCFYSINDEDYLYKADDGDFIANEWHNRNSDDIFKAYTLEELLVLLPNSITEKLVKEDQIILKQHQLIIHKGSAKYEDLGYDNLTLNIEGRDLLFIRDTATDAAGALLIALVELGIVKF